MSRQPGAPAAAALARVVPRGLAALLALAAVTAQAQPQGGPELNEGERLSDWLLRQPPGGYAPGLQWRVPQERPAQESLRQRLLAQLTQPTTPGYLALPPLVRGRYTDFVQSLPATGRVAIGLPDARWLQGMPEQDPVLQRGQTVLLPPRPATVTVLLGSGQACRLPHVPGADARSYLEACLGAEADAVEALWVAQPDGRSARYGVAVWNQQPQDEAAPGAWIWAPGRDSGFSEAFSQDFIRLLASQGPAGDTLALPPLDARPAVRPAQVAPARPDLDLTANDWGAIGLLQTPTARLQDAGNFRFHLSAVYPYTRLNFMFQPFDWLEAGFRYTDLANQAYNPDPTISTQTLKDKSLDVKLRLNQESRYLPQFALGAVDLGGTGLFAGEYLVASKRSGNLDFSLGLGWGYLGGRGDANNPLAWFNRNMKQRAGTDSAFGGTPNTNSMFTGPTAFFGGVQWRLPSAPLLLKLEYEGNDYSRDPYGSVSSAKSAFNAGLVYRHSPGMDFTVGYERGQQWMVGITLHENLARLHAPKQLDPPTPFFSPQVPAEQNNWQRTAQDIEQLTLWPVLGLEPQDDALVLRVSSQGAPYVQDRLQRAVAVLHRDAPPRYLRFVVVFVERGAAVHAQEFDRVAWASQQAAAQPPSLAQTSQRAFAPPAAMARPQAPAGAGASLVAPPPRYSFGVEPMFQQILGGPDAFVLYQAGIQAKGEYRFAPSTWLSGTGLARLLDNYSAFRYEEGSDLPRVRTYARDYAKTSNLNLVDLQLTHVGQLTDNQYLSVYGGLLESMFAGVGAEWLYRPWGSPLAWGLDLNHVRQRDFAQNFGLRDYGVNTGHLSMYWDTGWQNILAKVSAGQYLAGDRGATVDISRRFSNGVILGAWATKTNVSAAQFGEGSFDKGIYINIPFDAVLARSSNATANVLWQPLLRDGGARLVRAYPLYELSNLRDRQGAGYAPAAPPQAKTGEALFD